MTRTIRGHDHANHRGISDKIAQLPHIGFSHWNGLLPEFGVSEFIGGLTNSPTKQSGGSNLFGAPVSDQQYQNIRNQINATQPRTPITPTYNQDVLGASNTQGSYAPAPQQPSMLDQIAQNTRNVYQDQLNAANTQFDRYQADLSNQLQGLGREKDTLLDRIGSTYGGLVQGARDTLSKNLGLLEGRKGEVQQNYDVSRTNVARSLADAQRRNRQLGRAQGTLGSSYYTDLQTDAGRTADMRIGGLNTEESSKLDAIGSAILNANTDTNSKIQMLKEEQANAEQEQINRYNTIADSIRNDLRFSQREKLDALQAVNNRLSSALDNIGLTMLQYQAAAGGLGQTASAWTSNIQSYNPFGQIQNTLDTKTAFQQAYNPLQVAEEAGAAPAMSFLDNIRGRYDLEDERNRGRAFA